MHYAIKLTHHYSTHDVIYQRNTAMLQASEMDTPQGESSELRIYSQNNTLCLNMASNNIRTPCGAQL